MAKSPYDYKPTDQRDLDFEYAKGKVQIGQSDGSEDPVNTRSESEIRNTDESVSGTDKPYSG
jgi:hypothetical protein